MDSAAHLTGLPEEVLLHIGSFLRPWDLLALSAVCRHLRAVLNADCVWRQFTDGGSLSRGLELVGSVVAPLYSPGDEENGLQPLCAHRQHFLRQSRLLSNLRRGNFLEHTVPFDEYLADLETGNFSSRGQITYKGVYLFAIGYLQYELAIRVFDLKNEPKMIQSFDLNQHITPPDYNVVVWLQVSGDLLVVGQDNWIDVFNLKQVFCQEDCREAIDGDFPNVEVSLLDTIDINPSGFLDPCDPVVVQDFLLVESESAVHVWDLKTASRLDDIVPKVDRGETLSTFYCNYNKELKFISLVVTTKSGNKVFQKLFLYDLTSMAYKDFFPVLPETVNLGNCFCLFDACHFVIIGQGVCPTLVVYDIRTSSLLKTKQCPEIDVSLCEQSKMINGCLVLPTPLNIKVVSVKDLETQWELQFACGGLVPELPHFTLMDVTCVNMLNSRHLIALRNTNYQAELWDFENRRKLLDFNDCEYFSLNDTFSQVIILSRFNLKVFNFW